MTHNTTIYGYLAGICSASLLQPLQNIKMVIMIPPNDFKSKSNFLKNMFHACKYLLAQQGIYSLYKGIKPNLIKTGFSSAVYFSFLRLFENSIASFSIDKKHLLCAFISSSMGRVLSALVSNPFSVIETRCQIAGNKRWTGGLLQNFVKVYQYEGISGYFKGCLASCYKQGWFAGLYYIMYIQGKTILPSFVSGILSGMLATALTHPFELIRAKRQVKYVMTKSDTVQLSIFQELINIIKSKQMMKGLSPRLVKKPLANTIAFLVFQHMQAKH